MAAGGRKHKKHPAVPGGDGGRRNVLMNHNSTISEIKQALNLLFQPGDVIELRCLKTRKGTISGYFNDFEQLARVAASLSGNVEAVYVTLNPVNPDLLARSCNQVKPYARETTSDSDITARRWLPLDFDPVRPAGISSTDAEHELALERARQVRDWLRSQGWPEPIWCTRCNEPPEGCELRDVLRRLKVPGYDNTAACEYRQACCQEAM